MTSIMLRLTLFICLFSTMAIAQTKPERFENNWKRADTLIGQGLPKSALEVVDKIYDRAKSTQNYPQLVKAILHKITYFSYLNEDALVQIISDLRQEIKTAPVPTSSVLNSILGEVYWQFYQQNRWVFYNRTTVANNTSNDPRLWDARQVVRTAADAFLKSVEAPVLKTTQVGVFDDILLKGDAPARKLRPTLYDFLAHRAIDFFSSRESEFTQPVFAFSFDNPKYLSDYQAFIDFRIQNKDSLSLKFYALELYQNIGKFHANDADLDALVAVDLARLAFVKQNTTLPNADTLYRQTLLASIAKMPKNAAAYQFALAQNLADGGAIYEAFSNPKPRLERREAADLCREIIKNYPKSTDALRASALLENLLQTRLDVTIEEVNAPEKPFRALVTYQNSTQIFGRVFNVSAEEAAKLKNYYADNDPKKDQTFVNAILKRKPLRQWSQKLPDDGDLQSHKTEIKMPELPRGSYVFLGSDTEKFAATSTCFAQFQVSDLAYLQKQDRNQYEFIVTNRHTGAPVAGATVEVYEINQKNQEQTFLKKYNTDNEGFVTILAIKEQVMQVVFKHDKNEIRTDQIYNYYTNEGQEPAPKAQRKTLLFTDRAVYRPGQTIYFKGILFEGQANEFKVVGGQKMAVGLYDVNNEKVANADLISNEFGSFTGTFIAPTGRLTGAMSLRSDFDGVATVSVEEYKRPTFEVLFNAQQSSFKLNQMVKTSGKATSFAGVAVSNATVSYRVLRQGYARPWDGYFSGRGRIGMPANEMEISNGTAKTDENGVFNISFEANADLKIPREDNPIFSFVVMVDVTDANGETRQNTQQIRVGYGALETETSLKGTIDGAGKKEFFLRVNNLAGNLMKSTTQLTVSGLIAPNRVLRKRLWAQPDRFVLSRKDYEKDFPNDVYIDEDQPEKWLLGNVVFQQTLTDTATKFTLKDLDNWKPGVYVLNIKTQDERGETLTEKKYFVVQNATRPAPSQQTEDWVQAQKASGEPAENAVFLLGNAQPGWVRYEIERDRKIQISRWLKTDGLPARLEIPILSTDRGGFVVHFTMVQNGRQYSNVRAVEVPFTNKKLVVKTSTFRNKLRPGQAEQWKLQISGPTADKAMAELVASLYDASLDAIAPLYWPSEVYSNYYGRIQSWQSGCFGSQQTRFFRNKNNEMVQVPTLVFDQLNGFGGNYIRNQNIYSRGGQVRIRGMATNQKNRMSEGATDELLFMAMPPMASARVQNEAIGNANAEDVVIMTPPMVAPPPKTRKNFNETAFFLPQLQTDSSGSVTLNFTMPEALTRWRLLAFAHTKDMQIGQLEASAVTQKELMVTANAPRFFRENDKIKFTAKVENLAEGTLNGTANLELFDAFTMKKMLPQTSVPFGVAAGQSAAVAWDLQIPEGISAIVYKLTATAGTFSDGEEKAVPVLTDRILITETLPIWVNGMREKTFTLAKLRTPTATMRHQSLTLEMTSNPAWYALQSLPYLAEHANDCAEQLFSRLYANALGAKIVQSNPAFGVVVADWTRSAKRSGSPLLNNQDLKSVLVEETPWAAEARTEADRTARLAQFLDENKIVSETQIMLQKLTEMQTQTGAFPWFKGMPDDLNTTTHILAGLGKLQKLGVVLNSEKANAIIYRALGYADANVQKTYDKLKKDKAKLTDNHLSYSVLQCLYARSFYPNKLIPSSSGEAYDYFKKQAQQHWLALSLPAQGMAALVLNRANDSQTPAKILKSLKERATTTDEMGMYWPKNLAGYNWQDAPVETQALLIEVFSELTPSDEKTVNDLKRWLLKQKQTQAWRSTKATTEAIYALLMRGQDWAQTAANVEVKLGKTRVDTQVETKEMGTGYFKIMYSPTAILPDMAQVSVKKTAGGPSWGGLYWQYTEKLENVTSANTNVLIKKELYLKTNSASGPVITLVLPKTTLKVGDLVTVRVEIRTDRDMEFVHLKDQRSAGFEPTGGLSGYRYQNGLGYYEAPRDASMNFFLSTLPKGQHVFEYDLRVSHAGVFSNGLTTLQCLYAPEFTSHSASQSVEVK